MEVVSIFLRVLKKSKIFVQVVSRIVVLKIFSGCDIGIRKGGNVGGSGMERERGHTRWQQRQIQPLVKLSPILGDFIAFISLIW